MSELLKRADLFNANSDGISGKNPADAKLVADMADRIRYLEAPTLSKRVAIGFFQYWWNSPSGTNTNQGFDEYWNKLLMNDLELPSEGAVETVNRELDSDRARKERITPDVPEEEYDQKKMDRKYPFFTMNPKDW